jgi:hypothetical protein
MADNITVAPGSVEDPAVATDEVAGRHYQIVKLAHGADGQATLAAEGAGLPVVPANITGKFRESFETFTPGVNWNLTTGSGDIVQLDGNAASASYLVISKDPLTADSVTTLETIGTYDFPCETAVGLHMSQRVIGQELAMELVSTETPLTPRAELTIASIQQATTTLTITTSTPHGLVPGARIGIYGVTSDSRLNYASLVVAFINSGTAFACTTQVSGTIPSLTVGPYTNQGKVYFRSAMGYAPNGVSEIFENTSTTNASAYVRGAGGDVLPSGTVATSHAIGIASTVSAQSAVAAYTYAFWPSSEFRFIAQADRVQWQDVAIDSTGAPTVRLLKTQVVPDSTKQYKLRFRFTNNAGLTVPNAKIVSAVKAGSAVATITTAAAHGLTTGDFIVIYGIRDQSNFVNATTGTIQVASVISSTQFTASFSASATATSYGGMVARVQGANVPGAFTTTVAQSAEIISNGYGPELRLIGNVSWTWSIGDYVNVYGVRDNATGADLAVDGSYKVVEANTTTLRLQPIGSTTLPGSLALTNCGGTVIKRTDARISFVRIFDYVRERVEVQNTGAAAAAVPVNVLGGSVGVSGGVVPQSQNIYALQSSTNLAANAVFTGTAQNIAQSTTSNIVLNAQLVIGVNHTAGLTPGQLYLDLGTETTSTAPTVWYHALAVAIPSNAHWQQFSVPISTRYYRLRFVNGPTAQTNFRLSSFLTYNGGALSNPYSYPVNIQYQLSSTALAANATFTSVTLDYGDTMNIYQTITALAFSDQPSATNGFKIQISRDGTVFRDAVLASTTANVLSVITVHLSYRYARIVFINGANAQGSFNLDAHVDAG